MKFLYIYDKEKTKVCKFKVSKETAKTVWIDYQNGINLINEDDKFVWCHKERFHINEIDNSDIFNTTYIAATSLNRLYAIVGNYLETKKKEFETMISYLLSALR